MVLAIIYVLSPLDIVPDAMPLVGWLDDAGIILAEIAQYLVYMKNKKDADELNTQAIKLVDEYNKEYRDALYKAQTTQNTEELVEVFQKCQVRLNEKLKDYEQELKEKMSPTEIISTAEIRAFFNRFTITPS